MSSKNEASITEKGQLGRVVALAVLGYAFILMLLVVQIFLVAWSVQYAISDIGSLYFRFSQVFFP